MPVLSRSQSVPAVAATDEVDTDWGLWQTLLELEWLGDTSKSKAPVAEKNHLKLT